jgi:uncharacterized membrane protein YbaN (DUF454 family)
MKIWFWNILGLIAFGFGFLGLFLPVLPTTPLWLLAAYSFMRGSKSLYNWAMSFKTFNEIVTNFNIYRAIPLRIKIISIVTLWATICISSILITLMWVRVALLIIATAVTWHILSYPTLTDELRKKYARKMNEKNR